MKYTASLLGVAVFSASVLTIGWIQLAALRDAVDAAATVLLAGPALFGALAARPRPTVVGAGLMIGARTVTGFTGLAAFLAVGALVALPDGSFQRTCWLVFVVVSWLMAAVVAGSLVRTAFRR